MHICTPTYIHTGGHAHPPQRVDASEAPAALHQKGLELLLMDMYLHLSIYLSMNVYIMYVYIICIHVHVIYVYVMYNIRSSIPNVYVCVCVCVCVFVCVYIYIYIHVYIYVYRYTYIHTSIQTHIQKLKTEHDEVVIHRDGRDMTLAEVTSTKPSLSIYLCRCIYLVQVTTATAAT